MDQIDIAIIKFVNGFAGKSAWFDRIVLEVFQLNTFKMMPIVAAMVWLWFADDATNAKRKAVFYGIAGGFIALVITRVIQNVSPHKPRPALSDAFDFIIPIGGYTNDWSSFPSDTAGLAFALALGIWLASRRWGMAAFFWATVVISFPRLYGGYHYMSDLVAGAAIGMASTYVLHRFRNLSDPVFNLVLRFSKSHKPWFFMLAFILAFQTSTYFSDLRKVGEKALHAAGLK
jgi:membrane-associated phospholipid phosphatase